MERRGRDRARTTKHLLLVAVVIVVAATATAGWLLAAASRGDLPTGRYEPQAERLLTFTGPDAADRRARLLAAASPRPPLGASALLAQTVLPSDHPLALPNPSCRFLADTPSGTSPKFDCVLAGGEVVKVKYGRNPEIQAEAAATRLLAMLGYASDRVDILPAIRCYGCPRYPFATMQLLTSWQATGLLMPNGYRRGYSDFAWVGVERRLAAPAVETGTETGWAWWELERSEMPRDEADALRLLAVLLAHWDNKADNQRLVCMDPAGSQDSCAQPVLVLQDVGATFGPAKVNLARWHDLPIWSDRATCTVSMRTLPAHGGTFPDVRIGEAGRALFAGRLKQLSDPDIRHIFTAARFPAFYTATDDERDLDAWTEAFHHRVSQITDHRCPS